MRKLSRCQQEEGASLVELMIGVAILGLIATFTSNFFTRTMSADAESTVRSTAVNLLTLQLSAIERDLKLRSTEGSGPPALCPPNQLCVGFQYQTFVKVGAIGEAPSDVTVVSQCAPMPNAVLARFGSQASTILDFSRPRLESLAPTVAGVSSSQGGRCLKLLNCANGTFPRTFFQRTPIAGANNPVYPPILPDLGANSSAAFNVLGAATCAESITVGAVQSDRIVVEALILGQGNTIRMEKKEIILPRSNIAKIRILPN